MDSKRKIKIEGIPWQMKFIELIKQNKKIHYLCKALKHINEKEYVDFYLNMESDPRTLLFKKYGEKNRDKAIYYIPENGDKWGFFAEFRALLCKLCYAERMGFTPYVFWGSDFLYYDQQKKDEVLNAYEYYFEQPTGLTEKDVMDSYMVCRAKSAEAVMIEREFKKQDYYGIASEMEIVLADIYKKYIKINTETRSKLEEQIQCLGIGEDVLGIHFRGTDYQVGYNNHPVYVQVEEVIEKAKSILLQEKYKKVFLATDDIEALQIFCDSFGHDKLLFYEDTFRTKGYVSTALSKDKRQYHQYLLGYEVLRDMYTLAQCGGLLSGVSQVTNCARIVNRAEGKVYHSLDVIYHGVNHNSRDFR